MTGSNKMANPGHIAPKAIKIPYYGDAKMKKVIIVLLALVLALAVAGAGLAANPAT